MGDLTVVRSPQVIAAEINGIKAQTRTILLCSSIEIGRRLVEAKSLVEHGEWGNWLKNSVDYSPRTAQNLMKIFEEYGAEQIPLFGNNSKTQAFADLTYSQAIALLGVPAEEREQFMEENDVQNMSTRELQQAIKEREQAQKEAEDLKKRLEKTVKQSEKLSKENSKLKSSAKELREAQDKIKQLTEQINTPITLEPAIIEKVPEDVELELETLRRQNEELRKQGQPSINPAVLKFGVHFDALVAGFKNLLLTLAEIKETDATAHEKYKTAVAGLIGKMSEKL